MDIKKAFFQTVTVALLIGLAGATGLAQAQQGGAPLRLGQADISSAAIHYDNPKMVLGTMDASGTMNGRADLNVRLANPAVDRSGPIQCTATTYGNSGAGVAVCGRQVLQV